VTLWATSVGSSEARVQCKIDVGHTVCVLHWKTDPIEIVWNIIAMESELGDLVKEVERGWSWTRFRKAKTLLRTTDQGHSSASQLFSFLHHDHDMNLETSEKTNFMLWYVVKSITANPALRSRLSEFPLSGQNAPRSDFLSTDFHFNLRSRDDQLAV
jgi:hypothetical protein